MKLGSMISEQVEFAQIGTARSTTLRCVRREEPRTRNCLRLVGSREPARMLIASAPTPRTRDYL